MTSLDGWKETVLQSPNWSRHLYIDHHNKCVRLSARLRAR
jgi:hypothetical protein